MKMSTIIKNIPFIIPALACINVLLQKMSEYNISSEVHNIIMLQFDSKMPFYFNYWLIYLIFGIMISLIFMFTKKYTITKGVWGIVSNLILCIVIIVFILNRM